MFYICNIAQEAQDLQKFNCTCGLSSIAVKTIAFKSIDGKSRLDLLPAASSSIPP